MDKEQFEALLDYISISLRIQTAMEAGGYKCKKTYDDDRRNARSEAIAQAFPDPLPEPDDAPELIPGTLDALLARWMR